MRAKLVTLFALATAVVVGIIALLHPRTDPASVHRAATDNNLSATPAAPLAETNLSEASLPASPTIPEAAENVVPAPTEKPSAVTNKLERLNQIREHFRSLAAGDPTAALRAAKQIGDETERETALLTLVTEWTHGELGSPRRRARAIDAYGLEAGLAMELTRYPELAMVWANELTEGKARTALLQQTALSRIASDPSAAFAMSEQIPTERREFLDKLFAGWATTDTAAAIKWTEQLADVAERDAATQAIRTVAPVGIGAVLKVEDGYPVINQLLPGTPAERSGQIRPGDRILALAQGDNSFVDAHSLPLEKIVQMIRGAPNTLLQLQVLAADAPPNSFPRTVSIFRDQVKFKK